MLKIPLTFREVEDLTVDDFLNDRHFASMVGWSVWASSSGSSTSFAPIHEYSLKVFSYLQLRNADDERQCVVLTDLGHSLMARGYGSGIEFYEVAIEYAHRYPGKIRNLWHFNFWLARRLRDNHLYALTARHFSEAVKYHARDKNKHESEGSPTEELAEMLAGRKAVEL